MNQLCILVANFCVFPIAIFCALLITDYTKASGCSESTIRNIFSKLNDKHKGQDITIGMAFRLCHALDVSLSDIVKGLAVNEDPQKK